VEIRKPRQTRKGLIAIIMDWMGQAGVRSGAPGTAFPSGAWELGKKNPTEYGTMKIQLKDSFLLLLLWVVPVLHTEAWTPGYQMMGGCGTLVTGGSDYNGGLFPNSRNEIVLHNAQAGTKEIVRVLDKSFIDVHLSRSCKWISICEVGGDSEKYTTRIITSAGEDVRSLPGARFSEWGTDSAGVEYIAYIVGDYIEFEGIISKGTWLLNMETGEQQQIHARGYDVAWAEFDQCFYIADVRNDGSPMRKVERYGLKGKKSEETPYFGVDFSTNGTYYHTRTDEPSDLKVYLRATNKNISARYLPMFERYFNGDPSCWLNDHMIVFPAYSEGEKSRIIDFNRAEAWEVPERLLGFADKDEKSLLILEGGQIVTRNFEEVAKLIYPVPEGPEVAKTNATEKKGE
jgi:hypothetical protein